MLLLNSVLNPLTNSLSPSMKSKGARPHSATIFSTQIGNTGMIIPQQLILSIINITKFNELLGDNTINKQKINVSS